MPARPILLLGDPRLYRRSLPVAEGEVRSIGDLVEDLRDTLADFRLRKGSAKAIAAPQIGVPKRVVYVDQPGQRRVLLNPSVEQSMVPRTGLAGAGEAQVWETCMSFPDLLVRTTRLRTCVLVYKDLSWQERRETIHGELSVIVQHECDHLDGILAVSRAVDAGSFCLLSQRSFIRHMVP